MAAEWRSNLDSSLEKNRDLPYSKYFQLATVTRDGLPSNRTVVLRNFLGETKLTFVTDLRTKKVEDVVENNSKGAICWYFPESREQYRLTGQLVVVTPDFPDAELLEARKEAWGALSPGTKAWHLQPPPGQPAAEGQGTAGKAAAPSPPAETVEGPEPHPNFALVVLDPQTVDYVDLFSNSRRLYTRDPEGGWVSQALNP
eukprot:jgi/Botrbrau1/5645/Bobra.55_1s0033.1